MATWAPRRLAGSRPAWPVGAAAMAGLLLAAGLAALAIGADGAWERAERALLVQTALALAVFDARHLLIPDLFCAAFALAGLAGPLSPGLPAALAGAAAGAGLTAGVRAAAGRTLGREAMGWGDVKLAAALGALLGPVSLLWALAVAAGLAAAVGLARRGRGEAASLTAFGAWLAPVGVAWLQLRPPA